MEIISRRKLVAQAACTLSSLRLAASAHAQSREPGAAQNRKLKALVAGGHPGDPEYGCGGTIARYTERGDDVVLLYLNRGQGGIPSKPPEDARAIRSAEAAKACEILKARPLFAGQIDGNSIVDRAHYEEFRKMLEAERPDVVFTQWPIDGHPDHRATSMLCLDAWLRMGKSFALYYYEVSNGEDTLMFNPTHYVDLTSMEARKRAACYAHASQSPDHFYALQSEVARFRGVESGFSQAEAFIRQVQSSEGLLPSDKAARVQTR
jgi:LmbE family N-acetylglucosaminyl deacetylase